jgi:hypothetical protein
MREGKADKRCLAANDVVAHSHFQAHTLLRKSRDVTGIHQDIPILPADSAIAEVYTTAGGSRLQHICSVCLI